MRDHDGVRTVTQPVFRFAPSPNGRLHLGHAYSALLNHDMAKAARGRFLVRIEDIDTVRCKPEYIRNALDDLSWLGLTWEQPVRRQSEHFDDYLRALDRLKAMDLVYPAFLSRNEILDEVHRLEASGVTWARDPDGTPHYPGDERNWNRDRREFMMKSGKPFAWRLDMAKAVKINGPNLGWIESGSGEAIETSLDPSAWGDVLLARKDVPTSYHLSVVIDDALQGITDVVRGMDLFHATAIHRLLQGLLELPVPHYFHHRLINDDAGEKLAKSSGSRSLDAWRREGATPSSIRNLLRLPVTQPG